MWTTSWRLSAGIRCARRADMKPRSYGPFPYSPIIHRPRLEWPAGAHVALRIIPNIEYFSLAGRAGGHGPGNVPDRAMPTERGYGNRAGAVRMLALAVRHTHR